MLPADAWKHPRPGVACSSCIYDMDSAAQAVLYGIKAQAYDVVHLSAEACFLFLHCI